jgi:hypothetical protein
MGNLDIDFNLDSNLNFTNPENISFNGNYNYYYNEVKKFSPDLIISDLDIYTSMIAIDLDVELWQASPLLLYYGMNEIDKRKIGIYKKYPFLFEGNHNRTQYINYIIKNSNKRFAVSHICDTENPIQLVENYEYVRPDFILGTEKEKTEYLISSFFNEKRIINKLKDKDANYFCSFYLEFFNKLKMKDIYNEKEYSNYVASCKYFISDGSEYLLSDAFYNQLYCLCFPRYNDIESIICSSVNEYLGLGENIRDVYNIKRSINIKINDDVKFLSGHLEKL